MPNYINPQPYDLHLIGPDGEKVRIRRGKQVRLPAFFERYAKKGILKRIDPSERPPAATDAPKQRAVVPTRKSRRSAVIKAAKNRVLVKRASQDLRQTRRTNRLGHGTFQGATDAILKVLKTESYPISNGIGIGIMSYNRVNSLRRLVNSIIKFTDLNRTTIFISDDGSDNEDLYIYLTHLQAMGNIIIIKNEERIGIAGNSNRLLRCLSRFPKMMILNDDVEILRKGWDSLYFDAMADTNYHHFCYRQPGVYGAQIGDPVKAGNTDLRVVHDKPHGAVMALDYTAFNTVGYFDEVFGYYGMEHVDWSTRVTDSRIQPDGYYDVEGSSRFFRLHSEKSMVPNRAEHFRKAKSIYAGMSVRPIMIAASDKSVVPKINYVVPLRDATGRHDSILTTLNNVRAQRFPVIDIVIAEQDHKSRFESDELIGFKHVLVQTGPDLPFNKSKAFNAGVATLESGNVVLHDADTMVPGTYTMQVVSAMKDRESCFLGSRVYYADRESTKSINDLNVVDTDILCEKYVDYFEGGSLACTIEAFWKVGAFVEDYNGYGCEDCDFFARMSQGSNWLENRIINLIHLWHGRTDGWRDHHKKNKVIEAELAGNTIHRRIEMQRDKLRTGLYARFIK